MQQDTEDDDWDPQTFRSLQRIFHSVTQSAAQAQQTCDTLQQQCTIAFERLQTRCKEYEARNAELSSKNTRLSAQVEELKQLNRTLLSHNATLRTTNSRLEQEKTTADPPLIESLQAQILKLQSLNKSQSQLIKCYDEQFNFVADDVRGKGKRAIWQEDEVSNAVVDSASNKADKRTRFNEDVVRHTYISRDSLPDEDSDSQATTFELEKVRMWLDGGEKTFCLHELKAKPLKFSVGPAPADLALNPQRDSVQVFVQHDDVHGLKIRARKYEPQIPREERGPFPVVYTFDAAVLETLVKPEGTDDQLEIKVRLESDGIARLFFGIKPRDKAAAGGAAGAVASADSSPPPFKNR